jgi:hypothetical protein
VCQFGNKPVKSMLLHRDVSDVPYTGWKADATVLAPEKAALKVSPRNAPMQFPYR